MSFDISYWLQRIFHQILNTMILCDFMCICPMTFDLLNFRHCTLGWLCLCGHIKAQTRHFNTDILLFYTDCTEEQDLRSRYVKLSKYLWPRLYINVYACSYLCRSCRFWPVRRYMFPWSCRTSCQRCCSEDLQRPHSPESLRQRGTSHSNTAEQLTDCFPKLFFVFRYKFNLFAPKQLHK